MNGEVYTTCNPDIVPGDAYVHCECGKVRAARVACGKNLLKDALDLLESLEFGHLPYGDGDDYVGCLTCKMPDDAGNGHATDCRWLAVMRKAGRR